MQRQTGGCRSRISRDARSLRERRSPAVRLHTNRTNTNAQPKWLGVKRRVKVDDAANTPSQTCQRERLEPRLASAPLLTRSELRVKRSLTRHCVGVPLGQLDELSLTVLTRPLSLGSRTNPVVLRRARTSCRCRQQNHDHSTHRLTFPFAVRETRLQKRCTPGKKTPRSSCSGRQKNQRYGDDGAPGHTV